MAPGGGPDADGRELPVRWLLAEWPKSADAPTDYWLAHLAGPLRHLRPDTDQADLAALVRLAKLRWRIEHDYRELKGALGLDHFEGRTFAGWHRHTTLVSVAHGFVTSERLDPKARRAALG